MTMSTLFCVPRLPLLPLLATDAPFFALGGGRGSSLPPTSEVDFCFPLSVEWLYFLRVPDAPASATEAASVVTVTFTLLPGAMLADPGLTEVISAAAAGRKRRACGVGARSYVAFVRAW